jgi:hypothetical protein
MCRAAIVICFQRRSKNLGGDKRKGAREVETVMTRCLMTHITSLHDV